MKSYQKPLFILLFWTFCQFLLATTYNDYKIMIQTNKKVNDTFIQNLIPTTIYEFNCIASELNIYSFKVSTEDSARILDVLKKNPNIILAQKYIQKTIKTRAFEPNDPQAFQQIYLDYKPLPNGTFLGIGAKNAWDFGFSRTTKKGDTIVIAVIDRSFDSSHIDLDFFVNRNEIPNDGIDNDNNGAIDDYIGWNALENNGNLAPSNHNVHGTAVSGIAAAITNNQIGVAGVAGHVKVLPIVGTESTIDDIIKSYNYVLKMKKKYIETDGKQGAYIVVSNLSGGTIGFESDEPIWCQIYDSLGAYGILSVSASENVTTNIEVGLGDLPTNCSSPYLIPITSINESNNAILQSFGPNTIDLATYASSYSTIRSNQFGSISSNQNSYASPIVSGTIALMYSHFCEPILEKIKTNPKESLLSIKQMILQNSDTLPFLKNKIVSGAKLNTGKVIKYVKDLESKFGFLGCNAISIIDNNQKMPFEIYWNNNGILKFKSDYQNSYDIKVVDLLGKIIIEKAIISSDEIDLSANINGMYLVLIQDASGRKWSKKIVKLNDK